MDTEFPYSPKVRLTIGVSDLGLDKNRSFGVRSRIPSYAQGKMGIFLNGEIVAVGEPGTYVALERRWSDGDFIEFAVPMSLIRTQYHGVGEVEGFDRFGYMYGPVLMAVCGGFNHEKGIVLPETCQDLSSMGLVDRGGLTFDIPGSTYQLRPYFVLGAEEFTCFPMVAVN
jgi:DUF1680 family protein